MDLQKLAGFFVEHIRFGKQGLSAGLNEQGIADSERIFIALLPNLLEQLFRISHKVLISQYKLIEAGVSFDDFCASFEQKEIREYFFGRYPVMRRWMDLAAQNWLRQSCLLISRLRQDEDRIKSDLLHTDQALEIAAIQFNLGDAHRGGRSVTRIDFTNGKKIIYKPRSLNIDEHFSQLVQWLNQHGDLALQTPALLNCDGHGDGDGDSWGWVEFIEYRSCADQAEVNLYYQRLGAWLALLYVLEGTDFHYENIIAAGAHPVLIDLESFFHPEVPIAGNELTENFDRSVLRTGILPNRIDLDAPGLPGLLPDISGLADVEGQPGIVESLFMIRDEDGGIHFERKKGSLVGAQNVPRLHDQKVQLSPGNVQDLQQGFQAVYRTLLQHKEAFRLQLARFRYDEVRVLFRNTVTYGHLLDESTHPNLMQAQTLIDRHFELLALVIPDYQPAEKFVPFEVADMQQRDVPLFTTRADSRHLWYADKGFLADFFEYSGFDRVLKKLDALSERDMQHQTWLIEKTLTMRDVLNGSVVSNLPANQQTDATADYADPEQRRARLMAEALKVGDYIETQVHIDGDHANWVVIKSTSLDNRQMELIPAFYDLYCGMAGEILFLSHLAQISGKQKYRLLATKALNTLLLKVGNEKSIIRPLGLYVGWGGIIFTLTSLAAMGDDKRHYAQIERYFETVDFDELIAADNSFSLIKGAAGFMLACADYHLATGSARALQLAHTAAAHLLRHVSAPVPADTRAAVASWRIHSDVPLSGLAHGSSGFAMAFARLYTASREERYREVCLQALAHEATLFVPEQRNWRDCRDYTEKMAKGEIVCALAWAHGAPGIGLARIALLRAGIDTTQIRQDLEMAVRTTIEKGFDGIHTLIFGSFGNLELLLACKPYVSQTLAAEADRIANRLLQQIDRTGWQLGEKNFHPLGLMVGVTGIGYQCLRMAYPERVPAILAAQTVAQTATAMA